MLRDAVRAAATERTWSQGVALARDGRVARIGRAADEEEDEVRVPGRRTPFEVVVDEKGEEWQCDCTSKEPVCSHVVAAVLAVEHGVGESRLASLRYLLTPELGGVRVERVLVDGDRTRPL